VIVLKPKVLVLAVVAVFMASPVSAQNQGVEIAGHAVKFVLPLAGGALARSKDDGNGRSIGLSWVGALATALVIKQAVPKERPDGSGWDSFPSDSSATAFAAATAIQLRYGWDYGLPAYAAAAFVGYSRVAANKHDWGDIAAGAVLGWGMGRFLADPSTDLPGMQVFADERGGLIALRWSW
jgi:membrane-associated phospholipid phosphatase